MALAEDFDADDTREIPAKANVLAHNSAHFYEPRLRRVFWSYDERFDSLLY